MILNFYVHCCEFFTFPAGPGSLAALTASDLFIGSVVASVHYNRIDLSAQMGERTLEISEQSGHRPVNRLLRRPQTGRSGGGAVGQEAATLQQKTQDEGTEARERQHCHPVPEEPGKDPHCQHWQVHLGLFIVAR